MSASERQRLLVMERVVGGEMSLSEAARSLQVSYRQAQRVVARYRLQGDAGLVHKARGRPSCRQIDQAFKDQVLDLYRTRYPDFGPTLASESLAERDGILVNAETLRLWLIAAGIWHPRIVRRRHHTWRPRKACFGEMVQMDGSVHAWFEDRGPRCFVMDMVDDATGTTELLLAKEETTDAAMSVLEAWIRRYGIPVALYVDRKKVYVTDRKPTLEEQLRAEQPLTQFGRACKQLGIELIIAYSPQAKGRVERKHGVCQNRLIKALRLEGISDIEAANAFLPNWLPGFNQKFRVEPRSATDMHRPVPEGLVLESVFCRHEERAIQNDWTVRFQNRWFQLLSERESENLLPKCGTRLSVQAWRDGTLHFVYDGQELAARELPTRELHTRELPKRPEQTQQAKQTVTQPPGPKHPWRKPQPNYPEPRTVSGLAADLADRYLPSTGTDTIDATITAESARQILQPMRHF